MRVCRRCEKPKRLSEFGKNSVYKDKKHIYCKRCCIEKAVKFRKEHPTVWIGRGNHSSRRGPKPGEVQEPIAVQMSLLDNVLAVIAAGARTQPQIARKARVTADDLGLALVTLIIDQKKVASRVNGETREYFIRWEVAA